MGESVDIQGIPKGDLMQALWERSSVAAFFSANHITPPEFDLAKALEEFGRDNGRLDYLQGRVIKSDLGGDFVNPWGYDRDNGDGAFAEVVRKLREKL
ncbi:hypothetical protein FQN54_006976 [Arachnomyces sp. PD_36]|nr:hypothetical protein FQN54_006976 [Arachnomyces sp. PD_36]